LLSVACHQAGAQRRDCALLACFHVCLSGISYGAQI
jgi:hypothetical protein